MELVEYLMCVATRHEQSKDEHEEELKELWLRQKKKSRQSFSPTFEDETALLKGVIGSVRGKPPYLKKLTPQAIGALAYILMAKVANDVFIEGHEIVTKLVIDPEKTIVYLKGVAELKDQGWIRLIDRPGMAFTDQPPFSYLQSCIELGDTFHKEMGVSQDDSRSFTSNDAYLDAAFSYLYALIHDDNNQYRVNNAEANLATLQPEGWFRRIGQRVEVSTCPLPAAEAQLKYSLSIFQHLTIMGLLAMRDGDLSY